MPTSPLLWQLSKRLSFGTGEMLKNGHGTPADCLKPETRTLQSFTNLRRSRAPAAQKSSSEPPPKGNSHLSSRLVFKKLLVIAGIVDEIAGLGILVDSNNDKR